MLITRRELHNLACCISHNTERLDKEIEELKILLSNYKKIAYSETKLENSKDFETALIKAGYPCKQPLTPLLENFQNELKRNKIQRYLSNMFSGINYLDLNGEIHKALKDGKTLSSFVIECEKNLDWINYNFKRLADEKNYEGKMVILKGMLIYY